MALWCLMLWHWDMNTWRRQTSNSMDMTPTRPGKPVIYNTTEIQAMVYKNFLWNDSNQTYFWLSILPWGKYDFFSSVFFGKLVFRNNRPLFPIVKSGLRKTLVKEKHIREILNNLSIHKPMNSDRMHPQLWWELTDVIV